MNSPLFMKMWFSSQWPAIQGVLLLIASPLLGTAQSQGLSLIKIYMSPCLEFHLAVDLTSA